MKRGHDTPVEWVSTKRTWSSQSEMMSEKSNITMPPEEINNRRYIIAITEWRRKCQLLPQMSLESTLPRRLYGVVGKPTTKRISL